MKQQDFNRTMEAWAEREIDSAPEMRPTAEMYRTVEARKKASFWLIPTARRFALATAVASVASLVLLVALYRGLYDPFRLSRTFPGKAVTVIAMRQGFPSEKGPLVQPTPIPSRKGPSNEIAFFEQLLFQLQSPDLPAAAMVDVRAPREEAIALTFADNYRLVLVPARDVHLYILQLTSSGLLAQLFPNSTYTSAANPLRQGRLYHLPTEPNWFYLAEGQGEERLYIVASTEQLPELEGMCAQYGHTEDTHQKEELLSKLLKGLEIIVQSESNELAGWVFAFQHR